MGRLILPGLTYDPAVPATALLGPVVVVAVGLLVLATSGPVLRALPEPTPGPGLEADELATKPRYADLATVRFRLVTAALATAAAVVVVVAVPPTLWPPWLVLATLGVLLAAIDGVSTWLPSPLTRLGWLLVPLGALSLLLTGAGVAALVRVLLGAVAATVLFFVVWIVGRGQLAAGDVRFAPLLGAAGAVVSWPTLFVVLLTGTVLGALHGVVRRLRGRADGFPYLPGLVAGAFLALPLAALLAGR